MRDSVLYDNILLQQTLYFAVPTVFVPLGILLILNKEYMGQYKRTVEFDKYTGPYSFIRSGLLMMLPGEIIRYALCFYTYTRTFFGWILRELCSPRAYLVFQWLGKAMGYETLNAAEHWGLFTLAYCIDSLLLILLQLIVYKLLWVYAEKKYEVQKRYSALKQST